MALLGDRRTPASVRLLRADEAERVPETGAVSSVQEADVTLSSSTLARSGRASTWSGSRARTGAT